MVRITRNELGGGMAERVDGGAGVINFPTNGTLMTGAQMDVLIEYVQRQGTPVECGMLTQIKALVNGTNAYLRTIRQEQDCRHKAETEVHELRSAMSRMRTLLNATNSKTSKPNLLGVMQQVLDEIDVFEVTEAGE
jgi:hypothetical protein